MSIWLLFMFVIYVAGQTPSPSTYITSTDRTRLGGIFSAQWPFADLSVAYYSILGHTLLSQKFPNVQETCNLVKSKLDSKNLESVYHATGINKLLDCKLPAAGLHQILEAAIKDDASVHDLYFSVLSLKNLALAVDSNKVTKALTSALKKDDSVLNLGYAFHIASQLQGDLTPFFERIEDAIVQADEVDGKYLQFEGGLTITATIISGAYRLAEAAKKAPAISNDQAIKFTNYFLSRKFVQTVKGAALLLDMLKILTENKFHIPVAVTVASNRALSSQNPNVQVQVTNVLGASLGALHVVADAATRLEDNAVIMSKTPFTPVKGDTTHYVLNFLEKKPLRGFYKISLSAVPSKPDQRLIGNVGVLIHVKVMTEVGIENIEIGLVDRDQTTAAKTTKVEFNKQLATSLEADYHQKLIMKFTLKDKIAGDIMNAHQVFVQLENQKTKQQIVFVAEPDTAGVYKFDLDVNGKAKEFDYASGKYDLILIVGDAVIANPFVWKTSEIILSFPPHPNPPKAKENPYAVKAEIKHMFREQEKTPPAVVSNTFCGLLLVPFLLLLILWGRMGVNISNFPLSLSAIGFHLGLAAIFGLFTMFWLKWNMFTTLKYLLALGVVTFLSGHNLLSKLASTRK
ncbi:dolichyl-diphosphooligosaccharide--protein glycosyltransferase subunit 2-like isoform X2 [Centruroides sculpturatus]|uniref:dolichyl-diphosphooligosaccharide--protein glycosyltransferase subunit 2-like isoform X1 n=1 Tax=Centruroides sculpturatus TaxID=218467 RepID=UPI000C6EC53D|nr:dolichyl-diphosphooligosaccharide--protein glycosyltransferase subunit 2-like isoform X1 [Centruroides sculpturatus]XP_023235929.1 dolichyl-diphosphooligosaccharide--protein glycosyltransferase subunit 2-like isoform X2 [Centruroides sculpturatus]